MTVSRGLFVRHDSTRGTNPIEARQALAGLIPAPGVLDGLTVTGTASWQYSVAAGHVVTARDNDGVVAFANDAPVLVDCTPSPGTGARIDIVYAKHNDVDNADANSEAYVAVAEGIASGTPTAPEIPVGAVELARATVAAGATSTDHANVTISHADQKRAIVRGGIVVVNSDDQRDATYNGTDVRPLLVWNDTSNTLEVAWGDGWKRIYPAETVAGERAGGATNSVPNSTYTVLSSGSGADYSGGVSGGGGGLIVPVAGWYSVDAGIRWDANSTGYRIIRIFVNGSLRHQDQANAGGFTVNNISRKLHLQAGDNVTIDGWQNSGGTLSTSASNGYPYMSVALVGAD